MLLCRKLLNNVTCIRRNISVSSCKLLDVPSNKPLSEERRAEIDDDKKKMEWRIKPYERKGAWYSKFKLLMQDDDEEVKETFITRLQKPIDLRPSTIKQWYKFNVEKQERYLQQFIQERHDILGNDLAAAHFLVFRKGKVKFAGQREWIKMDEEDNYNLPANLVPDLYLEAIDCEGMKIYYEGLENLRRLKKLRFISFKDVACFDDWSLDRVSGSEFVSLEVLNLSGTKVTDKGLHCLYRIPSLRKLILDDPYRNDEWKLTVAMLQEIMPDLQIVESQLKTASVAEKA